MPGRCYLCQQGGREGEPEVGGCLAFWTAVAVSGPGRRLHRCVHSGIIQ